MKSSNKSPVHAKLVEMFRNEPVWCIFSRDDYETTQSGRMTYDEAVQQASTHTGQWATVVIDIEDYN
jgi:hypothetical protein